MHAVRRVNRAPDTACSAACHTPCIVLSCTPVDPALPAGSLAGLRASMAQGGLSAPFDAAGAGGGSAETAKYLRYERRGLWGQASYNIGYSYFGGLAVGGERAASRGGWECAGAGVNGGAGRAMLQVVDGPTPTESYRPIAPHSLPRSPGLVGLVGGVRRSPNTSPRVLLNSVLNGSGKLGSKTGNAAGVLALLYTGACGSALTGAVCTQYPSVGRPTCRSSCCFLGDDHVG